ncbi:hypothetical protein [Acinetobacter baumannii]|uniref:hypothetical protein n=1 Tax=Acinetobacter baumannii TaxID=470 RepID=UPI000DF4025F|nr:hypothetical protein [Acinetobacter baumannii]RCT89676.1 hypothetical protein DVA68_15870 [Acinetobacter baumannii]
MNNVDIDFENNIVEIEQIYALYTGDNIPKIKFKLFDFTLKRNKNLIAQNQDRINIYFKQKNIHKLCIARLARNSLAIIGCDEFDRYYLAIAVNGAIFLNQAFLTARSGTLINDFLNNGNIGK